jgi:hypothetical protein
LSIVAVVFASLLTLVCSPQFTCTNIVGIFSFFHCLPLCDSQITEAFIASRIPNTDSVGSRGINFGGNTVYSEATCAYILDRNQLVFVK